MYIKRLKADFSRTTLFGFSLGSLALHYLDEALSRELQRRGFAAGENMEVLHCLAILTIGNVSFRSCASESDEDREIPTVNYTSFRDKLVMPTLHHHERDDNSAFDPNSLPHQVRLLEHAANTITIIAPLCGGYTIYSSTYDDHTEHTPRTYLEPRAVLHPPGQAAAQQIADATFSRPGQVLVPVMIRTVFSAMLTRGPDITNVGLYFDWESGELAPTPLARYYRERVQELYAERINTRPIERSGSSAV